MAQRIPPHNEDAERSVLGAAMTSNDAMLNIAETLIPENFYSRVNREIFEVIISLYKKVSLLTR